LTDGYKNLDALRRTAAVADTKTAFRGLEPEAPPSTENKLTAAASLYNNLAELQRPLSS